MSHCWQYGGGPTRNYDVATLLAGVDLVDGLSPKTRTHVYAA